MPQLRILVVEDQDDLRQVWSDFLRHLGHAPVPAASVAEALACLASGPPPDFALVDWSLPDGIAEPLLEALARQRCPAAVATGHGEDVTEAAQQRAVAVMRKPFPLRELARLLRAATT